MIKELIQFTDSLDEELKSVGVIPKEGLHVVLSLVEKDGKLTISDTPTFEIFSKKDASDSAFLHKCAIWAQLSWMVSTNKCFDLPAKGIHSCSPFCLAFKKESIAGGIKFNDAKIKLYDRIGNYFKKANELLNETADEEKAKVFQDSLSDQRKVHFFLDQIPEFSSLKDPSYVVFYLDLPVEVYKIAYDNYLGSKLFNTEEYNIQGSDGHIYGTSNFFNGFNSKKPYLLHQSAYFDITGRITAQEAKSLFEFENIAGRRILPNPLPIFVFENERKELISIFKRDALQEGKRIGYREIIEELLVKTKKEVGNYYLLFYQNGQIKDFDFISTFTYLLEDKRVNTDFWTIKNLFALSDGKEQKNEIILRNTFDLMWGLFNIALGDKFNRFDNFFDDIKEENYKKSDGGKNDYTLMCVRKYRRSVYDFIYKSRRNSISASGFKDIMTSSIKDDLKYNRTYQIKEKLNIFFSLNHHFDLYNTNFKGYFMPDKLDQLIKKTMLIADTPERIPIGDETEFAFISGQIIDFLFSKSKSGDRTHSPLEGFLQKADAQLFKEEIARLFNKYKYDIDREDNGRVKRLMREVMGFDKRTDMRKLMTFVLAGYFSPSFYYVKKHQQ